MITPLENPLWGDGWHAVRSQWRVSDSVRHFNHGSYGAVAIPVREAQRRMVDRLDINPDAFYRRELDSLLDAARVTAAQYCGADPDGLAFVRNASEGMTVALDCLALSAADEMVVVSARYPAVRLALDRLSAACGVSQVEVDLDHSDSDSQMVAAIMEQVRPRTRAVVVDSVISASGRIIPIPELARLLSSRGDVALVVDAAHVPGSFDPNLDLLGVDLWIGNFHKWVCSPPGSAVLWAAPRWREQLHPASVSYRDGLVYPHRFGRLGTDDLSAYLAVPAAIALLDGLGRQRVRDYARSLAARGAAAIAASLDTEPYPGVFIGRHPVRLPRGIATTLDDATELQTRIALELDTEVSVNPSRPREASGTMAVSAFLYNHPDEYDEFAAEFAHWLARSGAPAPQATA